MNNTKETNTLYNSPLEVGLRALVILEELKSKKLDIQTLVYFDYLIVHSDDVDGPASMHPSLQNRIGELSIKREAIKKGLLIMHSKGLLDCHFDQEGMYYQANDNTAYLISYLRSEYYSLLKTRAEWIKNQFSDYTENQLIDLFVKRIFAMKPEVSNESALMDLNI